MTKSAARPRAVLTAPTVPTVSRKSLSGDSKARRSSFFALAARACSSAGFLPEADHPDVFAPLPVPVEELHRADQGHHRPDPRRDDHHRHRADGRPQSGRTHGREGAPLLRDRHDDRALRRLAHREHAEARSGVAARGGRAHAELAKPERPAGGTSRSIPLPIESLIKHAAEGDDILPVVVFSALFGIALIARRHEAGREEVEAGPPLLRRRRAGDVQVHRDDHEAHAARRVRRDKAYTT